MPAIKLLHTADLHLDSPLRSLALRHEGLYDWVSTASRETLRTIGRTAIEEGVRAVLIAGDLFDSAQRSARTAAFVLQEFDRLKDAGIDVFVIRGNHDAENTVEREVDYPDNVHVFDGRGGKVRIEGADIWVHGVSFRDRHAPESLLHRFGPPVPGAVNIGMLHTSLAGAPGHDVYAPCAVADLAAHGFDYWALGHVHARAVHSERPWIVMPGTPQGRDIGEAGAKSATLITVEDGSLTAEEVATASVVFRRTDCDLTGVEDYETARHVLRRHMAQLAETETAPRTILRLSLTGATALAWQIRRDADIWRETADSFAEDGGTAWIEKLAIAVTPAAAPTPDAGALSELGALMQTIRGEEMFRSDAQALVDEVLRQLPHAARAARLGDEQALATLADDLARDGAETILARLAGTVC